MERYPMSQRAYSANARELPHRLSCTDKRTYRAAFALTKEALWVIVLLSSLGLWAAAWGLFLETGFIGWSRFRSRSLSATSF